MEADRHQSRRSNDEIVIVRGAPYSIPKHIDGDDMRLHAEQLLHQTLHEGDWVPSQGW